MTDDRDMPAEPPSEPPAPPARQKAWGPIAAASLGLAAIVAAILYFTGAFGIGAQRRSGEPMPANSSTEAPAPAAGNAMGDISGNGLAAAAGGGRVNAAWLEGAWGQACPGTDDPDVTFQPGGRFRLGSDPGSWTLSGNTITVTIDGRPSNSIMTWDYVNQNTARVTRMRTGDVYYVYRCPA